MRALCRLPGSKGLPTVVLVDIPDNGAFYTPKPAATSAGSATREALDGFLADYTAGALPRQQLGRGGS